MMKHTHTSGIRTQDYSLTRRLKLSFPIYRLNFLKKSIFVGLKCTGLKADIFLPVQHLG